MSAFKSLKVGAGLLAVALAASACGGVASNSASEGTITLRTANVLPPDTAQSAMIDWFVEELEERTDGEVRAEVSYGGALVSGSDTLPALKQGRAEAGFVVPAYFPAELPLNNINMVPIPDASQAARMRALDAIEAEVDIVAEEFENNDIVLLGVLPNPSSTLAVTGQVENLDDLSGRKVRTPSQPQNAIYEQLGAEPVFLASEEIYEAIERNIIDATTFPIDVQISNGITEVADTLTPDVGQNGGGLFAMSRTTFDKLSDNAKSVIDDLRQEWPAKADEVLTEYEAKACETFLDEGGTIVNWTDEENQRLSELVDEYAVDIWKTEAQKSGMDEAQLDQLWSTFSDMVSEMGEDADYTDIMLTCGQ